jgi:hypothetical protein
MHEAPGAHTFVEPKAATAAAFPDLRIDTIELFERL